MPVHEGLVFAPSCAGLDIRSSFGVQHRNGLKALLGSHMLCWQPVPPVSPELQLRLSLFKQAALVTAPHKCPMAVLSHASTSNHVGAALQVRQDILGSLQLSNPAVLTSSFNRPNIHYTILLLDVQPAPEDVATTTSSTGSGSHARSAAGAAGAAAGSSGLGGDGDEGGVEDDVDHAGYAHLLRLLRPLGRRQRKGQQAGQELQRDEAPGQHQWPGPITIVYALKR